MYHKRNILKILIIFTLQLIFNSTSVQIQTQDNIISPSKLITLPSQNLVMTQKNINQSIIIQQPMSLNMVFSASIQKKSQSLNCRTTEWPFYRQTSMYYNIDQRLKPNKSALQIISATFYKETDSFILFILTSQGTIQKVKKNMMNFNQIIEDFSCSQSEKMSQINDLEQAYLYNSKHSLYIYVDYLIYSVEFLENSTFNFNLIDKFNSQIVQVVETGDKLYLLAKDSSIWTIQKDKIIKIFSVQTVNLQDKTSQFKPLKLSKIAIDQGVIYGLDKQNGVLRIASQGEVKVLKIQHSNFAISVNVNKNTMLITYLIRGETYITEYFLELTNPQNKGVHLNKIYTNFKDIRNVIMFQKYFLVGTQSQLVLAMHSINRNSPLFFHQKSQTLSNQYLDQIYELHSIAMDQIYPLSYMIVLQKSLSIMEFHQNQRLKYKQSWIQCKSSAQGSRNLTVTYIGLCASQKQPSQSSYCKLSANVFMQFKDSQNEQSENQYKNVLILIGTLIGSAVFAFILKKYFQKKQKELTQKITRQPPTNNKKRLNQELGSYEADRTTNQQQKAHQFNISQIQQ